MSYRSDITTIHVFSLGRDLYEVHVGYFNGTDLINSIELHQPSRNRVITLDPNKMRPFYHPNVKARYHFFNLGEIIDYAEKYVLNKNIEGEQI